MAARLTSRVVSECSTCGARRRDVGPASVRRVRQRTVSCKWNVKENRDDMAAKVMNLPDLDLVREAWVLGYDYSEIEVFCTYLRSE